MTFPLDQSVHFFPFMLSGYRKGESWKYFTKILWGTIVIRNWFWLDFVYLLFEVKKQIILIWGGALRQSEILSDILKWAHS
jgi:hypothetical protein